MSDSNYTPHIGPLVPHPKVEMRVTSGALERAHECDKARDAELAALRRRAQGVDVEAASRAIDNAILLASVYDGVAIDKDKVMADLAALRRALTRADEKDERASGKEPAP